MTLDVREVARAALGLAAKKHGAELLYHCPRHDDQHPSLKINPKKNAWLCGPCGKGGNAWELAAFLAHLDPNDKPAVTAWLRQHGLLNGRGDEKRVVAVYDYTDQHGKLLYQKVRYHPKSFALRRPDGKGGFIYDMKGIKPVLYNLPKVAKAEFVLLVEGEKDVGTAEKLGFVATTSGAVGSWKPELAEHFRGKRVPVIVDADEPGRRHARQQAADLVAVAERVQMLELPGAKDLTDWLEKGGTRKGLLRLIRAAPEVTAVAATAWKEEKAAQKGNDVDGHSATPPGVLLSEVVPEKVDWLWGNRVPLGKITLLDGDPGLGKSLLSLGIAAQVSRSKTLPGDDAVVSGGVVILSAEDGLGDTIRPRLEAAGADLTRIVAVKYTPEYEGEQAVSNIPLDIPIIMAAIERVGAKLVIVDVLMAYLPSDTNSYRDQDVRLALAPLAQMAEKMGVAVICIRHLTKAPGGNPIYRGGGSIGIIGGARAGLLVAKDPEDSTLLVLAQTKSNLGPPMPSLSYRIEANRDGVPYIAWQGVSQQTAASLLAAQAGDEEERGALAEAKQFLREELGDGRKPQKEIKAGARKAGIKDATLRRAKATLGVKSGKDGFTSEW